MPAVSGVPVPPDRAAGTGPSMPQGLEKGQLGPLPRSPGVGGVLGQALTSPCAPSRGRCPL